MSDHTHEFAQLETRNGTPILFPCRVCGRSPADVIAKVVDERDTRLAQVYTLLDAIAAILQRPRTVPLATPRRSRR